MNSNLTAFIIVAATMVASPGPDSILILRNTLASGRLPGGMTVAGVQLGIGIHMLLSVLGLSALLHYFPAAFRLLAAAGALYLFYLGYLSIAKGGIVPANATAVITSRRAFFQGMLCNLLNPKVIILFTALMPAFVDFDAGNEIRQIAILASVLLAINIPFQLFLVLIAARISTLLASPHTARTIQWGLGSVLILFALMLLTEHVLHYTR